MTDENQKLYHERQRLQLCALHSLNSLFQRQLFTKKSLDDIVAEFDKSWCWNEYSTFITGNYDLTIILEALKRQDYTLRAIDPSEPLEIFPFEDCFGLLLNIPLKTSYFDRLPVIRSFSKPGRHWLSITRANGERYFNFDSKNAKPELIGDGTALIAFLKKYPLAQTYIYLVIHQDQLENFETKILNKRLALPTSAVVAGPSS